MSRSRVDRSISDTKDDRRPGARLRPFSPTDTNNNENESPNRIKDVKQSPHDVDDVFGSDDHCSKRSSTSYRSPNWSPERRNQSRDKFRLSPLKEEHTFYPHTKDRSSLNRGSHKNRSESTGARSRSRENKREDFKASAVVIKPGEEEDQDRESAVMDPDQVIKHPLQNSWAMWFFKNDKSRDWKDNLRVITTFDTVEDFWGLYNHTLPASRLPSGCDYSVFKAGIQPMWEDAQNKKGGRWLINLNKSQRQTHLDDFWLETLLCLIGEGFDEHSEDICGATVNIRTKGDKLGLWTRDAQKIEATKKIGVKLKESLNVPSKIVIGFQAHSDTAGKAGSTIKNRFTV